MKKILILGDSITEGFDTKKYFPNYNLINKGVYGDNTAGIIDRLQKDVIDLKPELIIILIGTNDIAMGRTDGIIVGNIEIIAKTILDNLSKVDIYITSILPVRELTNRNNIDIKRINKIIKQLTIKLGINYLDIYSDFLGNGIDLSKEYSEDGLHLTPKGYEKWANLLLPFLNSNIQ